MRLPLCLCLLLAITAPAYSSPKLTACLTNATLPEVLARLQAFYGRPITAAADAAPGIRATLDWRDATLGRATRSVAAQFRLRVVTDVDGTIRFLPAPAVALGPTVVGQGLSVQLTEVTQWEKRAKLVGAGNVEVERALDIELMITDLEGEPQRARFVERVAAFDESGRPLHFTIVGNTPDSEPRGFPDEERHSLRFWLRDERPAMLARLDGEVIASRSVNTHHVEILVGEVDPGSKVARATSRAGMFELRLQSVRTLESGMLTGELALRWETSQALIVSRSATSDVLVFARVPGGRLSPVGVVVPNEATTLPKRGAALVTLSPFPADTIALVCHVSERSPEVIQVPFRFTNIPLPLEARERGVLNDATGSLLLRIPGGRAQSELSIGLARRMGKAWGPVRWTTRTLEASKTVTMERLTPGTYRVVAVQQSEDGASGLKRRFQARQSATVKVAAGGVARLELASAPATTGTSRR